MATPARYQLRFVAQNASGRVLFALSERRASNAEINRIPTGDDGLESIVKTHHFVDLCAKQIVAAKGEGWVRCASKPLYPCSVFTTDNSKGELDKTLLVKAKATPQEQKH
jgi:hypothetical protein